MAERNKRIVSYNGTGPGIRVAAAQGPHVCCKCSPRISALWDCAGLSVYMLPHAGATYGRVSVRLSMVISAPVQKAWKVAAQFGNMAQWL